MKRALDVAVAAAALTLLAPLLLLLVAAVRVTSKGPAIFRQERIGRHGQRFTVYKFRTMTVGADDARQRELNRRELAGELGSQEVYTLEADPRITPVGSVLRRTSLDELPQLVNVLTGDMSLVGPRPSLEWEVELFEDRYRRREEVRPGITGLWQVSGRRTIDMRGMLELDLEYVDRQSLWLDLQILARTVPAVLSSKGAA